jgi:ribonucleoside-diphosphate reductase alpha chain
MEKEMASESKVIYSYDEALEASRIYFNCDPNDPNDNLPAKVFLDKYALQDNEGNLLEKTPDQMHRRIAREFARIERKKFKKPLSEDTIFALLDRFGKIIPQGSPMYGIGNKHQTISLSNCFVVGAPLDSYGSILQCDEMLAQISKRRGGNGVDIENIRPAGTVTHNAARTATGTIPFCSRYSNTIREVGQNGRRGALMISQNIHHPESVIPWDPEVDGEETEIEINDPGGMGQFKISSKYFNPKRLDFASMKYDKRKVTGANVSIRVTDEFLNAVEKGEKYQQRWPVDNKVNPRTSKWVDANQVWDKIIYGAWRTAEPGVLFWDNIIRESVADCYAKCGFKTVSTNPCGEIPLSAFDSCRLLLLNLFGYVKNPFTKDAYFDFREFFHAAKIAQRLMDDLVDLEEECILEILAKIQNDPEPGDVKRREIELWNNILKACRDGRRTGTGITALGDTLAAMGIGYGTEEGVAMTERIYKTLKFGAYVSSVEMAKELGAFPVWDHALEKDNPFINRFRGDMLDLGASNLPPTAAREYVSGDWLWEEMKCHGRRNISLLTTAPAGSVSIVTKILNYFGSSSGIEPQFDIKEYTRKKKGNPGDKNFRIDSVDQNGDHWMHFEVLPAAVKDWKEITNQTDITKSPWHKHCAVDLDWTIRVRLQAAAQKHVDHSISSTVNLPADVTVEKVKEIYVAAWKAGCKGITVYRDGCRTGVLVRADGSPTPAPEKVAIPKTTAPKRPATIPCDVHHIKVKGVEYFVLVGLFGDAREPYEIFAGKNGMIAKSVKTGTLTKHARGKYHARFDDGSELTSVADYINDEQEAVTRMASMGLRHGADIQYVVHQLEKVRGDLTSFSKAMARALKKYIPDNVQVSGEVCAQCGLETIIRQEGCLVCKNCGASKCN